MNRQEKRHKAVANVIKRLEGDGNASEYIQKILSDEQFKLWLDTWVIAPLEMTNKSDEELTGNWQAEEEFEAGLRMSS